jgi:hypothetical protein
VQRSYQERGVPLVGSATTGFGARVAYLDMELGSMLELIELSPQVEQFFGMVQAAAKDWNGQDPVRMLG